MSSIYQSAKDWVSPTAKDLAVPVAKGFAITALALAVWKYATRETASRDDITTRWECHKENLNNNFSFLEKIKAIYTFNKASILNTKLELQPKPNCFEVGFNRISMRLGYADRFEGIRAINVLNKIKEFINEHRDDIYLSTRANFNDLITTSLSKLGPQYSDQVSQINTLIQQMRETPSEWKIVGQLEENQIKEKQYPFMKEIREAAEKREDGALSTLQKYATIQRDSVAINKISTRLNLQTTSSYIAKPFDYQTEPLKNAFIQLAIYYYNTNDHESAKRAIQQAFEDTELKSNLWNETFDDDFYQFLQETCMTIGDELPSNSIIRSHIYSTAKEWLINRNPTSAPFLAFHLKRCDRDNEALEYYLVALKGCDTPTHKAYYTLQIMELYKEQNRALAARDLAKKYFEEHPKEGKVLTDQEEWILSYLNLAQKCVEKGSNFKNTCPEIKITEY